MENDIIITAHAGRRLKERSGLNKKSIRRIAERAYLNGIKHSEVKGNLRKWVDGIYLSEENANNIRLYGDKIFLFHNNLLITVMQIPSNLRNELDNYIKKGNKQNESKKAVSG